MGAILITVGAVAETAVKSDGAVMAVGMAERRLAGVDVIAGRYSKPADLHKNAVVMENDANGLGGGDESLEWDTPNCHVRVLSRYTRDGAPRTTYSVTVTRPEDQPAVGEPLAGSCSTARGVALGDAAWKAIAAYGSRVKIMPGKHSGSTILHWEWSNGTVIEITVDAESKVAGLDLTGSTD